MILKKLLGEIMTNMGFLTKEQLDEALHKQRSLFEEKTLPERVQRTSLVSEARLARQTTPPLGQILIDMGVVTQEQVQVSLKEQEEMVAVYQPLPSEKLGASIEIGSIVNSTLDLAEVLALIMKHTNRVTNSVASTLMLLDDNTGELVFSVPTGPQADRLTDMRLAPGKGIAGWVAEHEQPLLIPNVREDPRFYREIDKISGFETRSILCVPLKAKMKLIGVLEAINKADGTFFTEEDEVLLSVFAYQAAMAIENARLYGEVIDRFEEEQQMRNELAKELVERKQAQEEKEKLEAQLRYAQKMEAIGTLAGGIAHDFNNLLTGILGNTSLMLLDTDTAHPHYERLKGIERLVQSASKLTSQLLGYARKGRYEIRPLDLNCLVEQTSETFARTRKDIIVHRDFTRDLFSVEADQGQIEQVLLNLYVNAADAMPAGGELGLKTRNTTHEAIKGKPYNPRPGAYVLLAVIDTGTGMDVRTMEHIFDPFFTTKERGRGTGLGLASVYGIVKGHGGYIDVESKKGEGSTFTIYLPASLKKLRKQTEGTGDLLKGTETLLLVDDEEMIINVGEQMLKTLGYTVLAARSGREAIGVYETNKAKIHMVILDMIMPGMGGGETYARLKQINPNIKVLLSSGYSIDGQATEILERGCDGFIQKPFNIKQLSRRIREIFDKK
jgi:signal transduction histidine kinase/CheY-like chemotaxis protein